MPKAHLTCSLRKLGAVWTFLAALFEAGKNNPKVNIAMVKNIPSSQPPSGEDLVVARAYGKPIICLTMDYSIGQSNRQLRDLSPAFRLIRLAFQEDTTTWPNISQQSLTAL